MLICWIPSAYVLASKVSLRLVTFCLGKKTRRTIGDMVVRSGKRWKTMLDIGNWYRGSGMHRVDEVKRYSGTHIGP